MADSRQGMFRNECASRVWKEIADNNTTTMFSESDFLRGVRLFYFKEKEMNNFFKKGITFALAFTLVVTMCFGGIGTAKVYAADTALSVYDGDTLVKEYTLDDLKAIAKAEGDKKYKYSGYNRNPSFYTFGDENAKSSVKEVVGPTVAGILADAGVNYTDDQLITFAAPDGVSEAFIAGDLFKERYYFPNGRIEKNGDRYFGRPAEEANYEGAESVPPMIDLYRSDEEESVLRFGQTAPNEQNNATFIKYIADGGKIIMGDTATAAWEPIAAGIYKEGVITPGTSVYFDLPASMIGKKVAAYYTLDGSEPGHGDSIYNYDKYGGVYAPIFTAEGTYTIKIKVIGYGKLDSETTTFTYEVKDVASPASPTGVKAKSNGYDSVKLTWNEVADADGYAILKRVNESTHQYIGDVTGSETVSYIVEDLETGVTDSYQVQAYYLLNSGQKVYSESDEEVSATPVLTKPTLNRVAKTGYAGIQVKWSKVDEATGYEVIRTDAKGNKHTKTFANNSTVSWKNTGLKTGTKYTYKVRAYKTLEDGTKIYSAYTGVKSETPALAKPAISKLTAASKAVTVKWGKVAGANGYKVYRSTAKNGKYTCVKTITKGGTVSWKNTGLKKGKTYYYKVKAYRIVDKKYVYSSISSVKYIKSK